MTTGSMLPLSFPTPNPISRPVPAPAMSKARPWLLSEVAVAARPILAAERAEAHARKKAASFLEFQGSSEAPNAVGSRWGKAGNWIRWILKTHDAALLEPSRFGPATEFLDAGGAPHVAWARITAAREAGTTINLPALTRQGGRLLTDAWIGRWSLVDIDMAARALLESRIGHAPLLSGTFDARERKALIDVAKLWGERPDFLQRIFEVTAAAAADPDRFGPLVQTMCRANSPTAAWGSLKRRNDEQRCLDLTPATGRFKTLVVDPPWGEDNISAVAGHDYALMSLDAIRAMPIPQWADDDCHLYLWFTANTFTLIPDLLRAWDFNYKTKHTWVKETNDAERNDPKLGLGRYFRNTTEEFVFATRGSRTNLPRRKASQQTPTHHRWPVGRNSEKPEEFYALVRDCSYPAYGEAFQRIERPDFVNLYQPRAAFAAAAE